MPFGCQIYPGNIQVADEQMNKLFSGQEWEYILDDILIVSASIEEMWHVLDKFSDGGLCLKPSNDFPKRRWGTSYNWNWVIP